MSGRIRLLDCTLRDGAYVVEGEFGKQAITGIIGALRHAGVDIIECGWLKDATHRSGSTFYHTPGDLLPYLGQKDKGHLYTAMIDWNRYDVEKLPPCDGKTVDAVRVVFPRGRFREGVEVGRRVLKKGYRVCYQAANTLAYSNEDLLALADAVNCVGAFALSVVDTFGAMQLPQLERIVAVLHEVLDPKIELGFHSHNNQQLSFALTMRFAELMRESGRAAIVDASLCGMGRGAGNTPTELVASYLNRAHGACYDMDALMGVIDREISYFKERYTWGYTTPYFLAGLYCCHVNNIEYLMQRHGAGVREIRRVIAAMPAAARLSYDYDLLEEIYQKICGAESESSPLCCEEVR